MKWSVVSDDSAFDAGTSAKPQAGALTTDH